MRWFYFLITLPLVIIGYLLSKWYLILTGAILFILGYASVLSRDARRRRQEGRLKDRLNQDYGRNKNPNNSC